MVCRDGELPSFATDHTVVPVPVLDLGSSGVFVVAGQAVDVGAKISVRRRATAAAADGVRRLVVDQGSLEKLTTGPCPPLHDRVHPRGSDVDAHGRDVVDVDAASGE